MTTTAGMIPLNSFSLASSFNGTFQQLEIFVAFGSSRKGEMLRKYPL